MKKLRNNFGKKASQVANTSFVYTLQKRGFLFSVVLHATVVVLLLLFSFWPKPQKQYRLVELLPMGTLAQPTEVKQIQQENPQSQPSSPELSRQSTSADVAATPKVGEKPSRNTQETAPPSTVTQKIPQSIPTPLSTQSKLVTPSSPKTQNNTALVPNSPSASKQQPGSKKTATAQPASATKTPTSNSKTEPKPAASIAKNTLPSSQLKSQPQASKLTASTPPNPPKASPLQRNSTDWESKTEPFSTLKNQQSVAQAIRERLERRIGRTGVSGPSHTLNSENRNSATLSPEVADFYAHVRDVYYRAWRQPLTQSGGLTAVIKIRVDREGNILHSAMHSPSGNLVMDESVRAAAAAVKSLGRSVPSTLVGETVEITIIFEY